MNTQHTQGPWWIGTGTLSIYSAEGRIADLKQSANDDQDEADARLIAAAPDLLEALKAMLEVHGVRQEHAIASVEIPQSWVELSDVARAAIAKATGAK